jgi:hypothetical protein
MSYPEADLPAGTPVTPENDAGVPLTGDKPAGYDVAQKMNGEAFDDHEIGSCWTPVGEDF